jgi:hypothetical protein
MEGTEIAEDWGILEQWEESGRWSDCIVLNGNRSGRPTRDWWGDGGREAVELVGERLAYWGRSVDGVAARHAL